MKMVKVGDVAETLLGKDRYSVFARVLKINHSTVLVRLPDGKVVLRKKKRDFIEGRYEWPEK